MADTFTMAWTVLSGAGIALVSMRYFLRAILGRIESMSMRGKHCLVTGGSSGIGKEVAKVC